jgi:hypothetical protein
MPKEPTLSEERAEAKQASREQDVRDLASGAKTREQLRQERGAFAFPRLRIRYDLVKSFV